MFTCQNTKLLGCRDPRCKHENPSITMKLLRLIEWDEIKKINWDENDRIWFDDNEKQIEDKWNCVENYKKDSIFSYIMKKIGIK